MKNFKTSELEKIFIENGFIRTNRGKGSHTVFVRNGEVKSIPTSKKEICGPMAMRLLKEAKIVLK